MLKRYLDPNPDSLFHITIGDVIWILIWTPILYVGLWIACAFAAIYSP